MTTIANLIWESQFIKSHKRLTIIYFINYKMKTINIVVNITMIIKSYNLKHHRFDVYNFIFKDILIIVI